MDAQAVPCTAVPLVELTSPETPFVLPVADDAYPTTPRPPDDALLGAGAKAGFQFTYVANAYSWTCSADPQIPGTTGDRYFFVDQSGVIRFSTTATATVADTPLQ